MRIAVVAVTLALVGPSYVWAESLGEVAAREREKKKGKPAGKVITEQDLGKRHGKGNYNNPDETQAPPPDTTEPATGETPAVAADGAAKDKPKTTEEIRAEAQAAWRKRLDEKNKQIAALQAQISQIEGGPNLYADAGAQARLKKAQEDLAAAQADLANLDSERRRNGWR
jgi:hypothetical protein